jgi:hypothetical protein
VGVIPPPFQKGLCNEITPPRRDAVGVIPPPFQKGVCNEITPPRRDAVGVIPPPFQKGVCNEITLWEISLQEKKRLHPIKCPRNLKFVMQPLNPYGIIPYGYYPLRGLSPTGGVQEKKSDAAGIS